MPSTRSTICSALQGGQSSLQATPEGKNCKRGTESTIHSPLEQVALSSS